MSQPVMTAPGFNSLVLMCPPNPRDRSILGSVDTRTSAIVNKKYGFYFAHDWMCTTVSAVFFRTMIQMLAQNLSEKIRSGSKTTGEGCDFYKLFSVIVSNLVSEKAEKEGNINTFFLIGDDGKGFIHGQRTLSLISNGPPTPEEDSMEEVPLKKFSESDPESQKFYIELDRATRYSLATKNTISIPYTTQDDQARNTFATVAVAYHFMEQLFVELMIRLKNPNEALGETSEHVIVNFMELMEIHGECKDGNGMIYIRPGIDAKRYAKNDEATERTMGELSGLY